MAFVEIDLEHYPRRKHLEYFSSLQYPYADVTSNVDVTWGKFQEDANGRLQLPVTILAHHGLVDGIHIAKFYQNLEAQIQSIVD